MDVVVSGEGGGFSLWGRDDIFGALTSHPAFALIGDIRWGAAGLSRYYQTT
jgi:hypothetical protein